MYRTFKVSLLCSLIALTARAMAANEWRDEEWAIIESLSLAQLPAQPSDRSNRYLHDTTAVALGKALFFDPALSANGKVSCASCHQAERWFSDARRTAQGLGKVRRHTPSLLDVAYQQWFFWDGRKDSLWAQALVPLENPLEHGLSRVEIIRLIAAHPRYRGQYERLFSALPTRGTIARWPHRAHPDGDLAALQAWKSLSSSERRMIDRVFTNIGKSIAAYVATLRSGTSKFDRYVHDYVSHGHSDILTDDETDGLHLFIHNKAACINCHNGPLLSNQGFHNIGTGVGGQDLGRGDIVAAIQWDKFNCLGEFSDAPKDSCTHLLYMNKSRHENSGAFKVPSLRNVANTAPYMHDGRYDSVEAVLQHYVEVSHLRENTDLTPMRLTPEEIAQLAAFLRTLSEPTPR